MASTNDGRGEFFHIDRRIWEALCAHNDVRLAICYLVIAQGTLKGGRYSSWSARSIENFTGIHHKHAKARIEQLIALKFLALDCSEYSTKRKPRYIVQPYSELGKSKYPETHLIWLPNALVRGEKNKGNDEVSTSSPLALLRASGDIEVLRLLVLLYDGQDLSSDRGISRKIVYRKYEKKALSMRGVHAIWGFNGTLASAMPARGFTDHLWSKGNRVWDILGHLIQLGLIYEVPHLVESDAPDAEIIHAYGIDSNAEPMERELGDVAQEAAEHMLGEEWTHNHVNCGGWEHLAPVFKTIPRVELVGIYRLRYRPRTSLTSDWYRRVKSEHGEWIGVYQTACGLVEMRKSA
jgi:hypothetical protein